MVSVYDLKPKFQTLLRPLCRSLAALGVTANQVTLAAALISIAYGLLLVATGDAPSALACLPLLLFLRMALNAIDGMLAREYAQKSRLGAVLNELGDVVSDTALYLPFEMLPGASALLVGLVVAIAVMSEMTGVVAVQIGSPRRYDGPFGKSDRAVFFGVLALAIGMGAVPGAWLNLAFALAALAGLWTIVNRARAALASASS